MIAASGCGGAVDRAEPGATLEKGSSKLGGQVVSTVNGHAITLSQVQELVELGMSPQQALRTLQAELLLIGEAERRGFVDDPEVQRIAQQARAQALLEQEAGAVRASEAELREAYAAAVHRFVQPERRASFHVLAGLEKDASPEAVEAAAAFIRQVIEELRVEDAESLIARYHRQKRDHFRIVAQSIPAAARQAAYEDAYLQALFSVSGAGVVPYPVRTSFGWHAVKVTEVVPAKNVAFEEARAELESELLTERRAEHVEELLRELAEKRTVQLRDGVTDLLATVEP